MDSNTLRVQWWGPYGLGWVGIHSLDAVLLQKLTTVAWRGRALWALSFRKMVFGCLSMHKWHNNLLENIIGVPFHIQVCPPQVWLSLWMTWPRAIFDIFQPVCNVRLYEFDTVVVDTWYSSSTVFTDLPDSRYPIKLNHAVPTTSVSHSKMKPLCKFDLLFPFCGKAFTHQWQIGHFCNFYFCTLEEKNDCVHSCVQFLFKFF